MKKGSFNNGDVGEFWLWVFCAVAFFTCLIGAVFGGATL
jgi:hypothetical protein